MTVNVETLVHTTYSISRNTRNTRAASIPPKMAEICVSLLGFSFSIARVHEGLLQKLERES
jgi:hypothetical protein